MIYEIRVAGRASPLVLRGALADLEAVYVHGETILAGQFVDADHLQAVLGRLPQLGLTPLEIHQVSPLSR